MAVSYDIYNYLLDNPSTVVELAYQFGRSEASVRNSIKWMKKHGAVKKRYNGNGWFQFYAEKSDLIEERYPRIPPAMQETIEEAERRREPCAYVKTGVIRLDEFSPGRHGDLIHVAYPVAWQYGQKN